MLWYITDPKHHTEPISQSSILKVLQLSMTSGNLTTTYLWATSNTKRKQKHPLVYESNIYNTDWSNQHKYGYIFMKIELKTTIVENRNYE